MEIIKSVETQKIFVVFEGGVLHGKLRKIPSHVREVQLPLVQGEEYQSYHVTFKKLPTHLALYKRTDKVRTAVYRSGRERDCVVFEYRGKQRV